MLIEAGIVFAGNALFPRLAYRLRWPTRLRGWALLAYIAWNTAILFSARHWVVPALRDAFETAAADQAAARDALRADLGREPTSDEVMRRVAEIHGWEDPPLMPHRGARG